MLVDAFNNEKLEVSQPPSAQYPIKPVRGSTDYDILKDKRLQSGKESSR